METAGDVLSVERFWAHNRDPWEGVQSEFLVFCIISQHTVCHAAATWGQYRSLYLKIEDVNFPTEFLLRSGKNHSRRKFHFSKIMSITIKLALVVAECYITGNSASGNSTLPVCNYES